MRTAAYYKYRARIMRAHYAGKCYQCGAAVAAGEEMHYIPSGRRVQCMKCYHNERGQTRTDTDEHGQQDGGQAQNDGQAQPAQVARRLFTREELAQILLTGGVLPDTGSYELVTEDERAARMQAAAAADQARALAEEEERQRAEEQRRIEAEQDEAETAAAALAEEQERAEEADAEHTATLEDKNGRTRHTVTVKAHAMTRTGRLLYLDIEGPAQALRAIWARIVATCSARGGATGVHVDGYQVQSEPGQKYYKLETGGRLVMVHAGAGKDEREILLDFETGSGAAYNATATGQDGGQAQNAAAAGEQTPAAAKAVIAKSGAPALDAWVHAIWQEARAVKLVQPAEQCSGGARAWVVNDYRPQVWIEALQRAWRAGKLN